MTNKTDTKKTDFDKKVEKAPVTRVVTEAEDRSESRAFDKRAEEAQKAPKEEKQKIVQPLKVSADADDKEVHEAAEKAGTSGVVYSGNAVGGNK